MERYKILMTIPAINDLREIAAYISNDLKESITAQKLIDKMEKAVTSLAEIPTRHGLVADKRLARRGIRKLLVDNYLVFYVVSGQDATVTVIRILYSRRDWEHLL